MTTSITDEELAKANKRLSELKILLMENKDSAFISTVCFSLKHEFTRDPTIPTACTDGSSIIYNIDFFNGKPPLKLKSDEQLFVLLHETWHVAFSHCHKIADGRFDQYKDKERLNIAMDYVINNMLHKSQIRMPSWVCMDLMYDNMSTEEVYAALPEKPIKNNMGNDVKPPEGDPQEENAELTEILIRAQMNAKSAGNNPGDLPGEIGITIEEILDPKLPWHILLRKFFTNRSKADYSWSKPNKRYTPDYYLPSAFSESLGTVGMAVDMSGSITDEETKIFISDVYHVLKQSKPNELTLVQFDTRIISTDKVKSVNELLAIDFKGRGGTDIKPALNWAKNNKPDVFVIFTDGRFYHPNIKLDVPVLWIIYDNSDFQSPIGQIIHYDLNTN